MKFPLRSLLLPAACTVFASTAGAQTITPTDRVLETAFYAEAVEFLYITPPNPAITPQQQQAGLNIQTVAGFDSGYVYDFCADFFTGVETNSTFNVTPGLGGLGSTQQSQVQILFSNALPIFTGMLDDYIDLRGSWANPITSQEIAAYDELLGYAGGMQIALWELIHETGGQLSIDDAGGIEGNFFVDMDGSQTIPGTKAGTYAEGFLQSIRTGTNPWTDQGGFNYYYADPTAANEQDRIWVTPVPEPSSALLGAAGFLLLLRRRRA